MTDLFENFKFHDVKCLNPKVYDFDIPKAIFIEIIDCDSNYSSIYYIELKVHYIQTKSII